jgi:3-deoxy-D-manno-octulosonic-acid transferase
VFYSFSIRFYYFVIWILQFFNPKAKKWILGRKKWHQSLPIIENKEVIWFHCASLGEFDQGLPLMRKIKIEKPTCFLLVTFFSPSGFENYTKRNHQVDFACYIPLDTSLNARKFINHFQPSQAFFVKYEFWYKHLKIAKKNNVRIYSICTIFRKNHRFFKWYGHFFRKSLYLFDYFFVQTEESIALLKSIGIENSQVVGDMRFDAVIESKANNSSDSLVEKFIGNKKCFIIGSSWTIDEQFLANFMNAFSLKNKIIIAPHDISEFHLSEIEKRFASKTIRYTEQKKTNIDSDILLDKSILIIDCIGKLTNLYQYAQFAYVGGGFTGKLHNILEAAVYGLPIIIGPKHSRFPEAQYFIENQCVFSTETETELNLAIKSIINQQEELKTKILKLVEMQKGATEKIYELL